jgi:hypothetical protein
MRKSAGKDTIRKELHRVFDEAGKNPPDMNRAFNLVNARIHASRRPVREVLNEDEFLPRRPKLGRPKRPPGFGAIPDTPLKSDVSPDMRGRPHGAVSPGQAAGDQFGGNT